jgi:hypothetical protein
MDRLRREQADFIESELFVMKTGRLRVENVSYVGKKIMCVENRRFVKKKDRFGS